LVERRGSSQCCIDQLSPPRFPRSSILNRFDGLIGLSLQVMLHHDGGRFRFE
jgi:hypothetical protein